jgi:dynein heavy chain 2
MWAKLVSPFIGHWQKLGVQQPRVSSESMGKTSALDPVDGFVKQQVETAEKLVAAVGGAFASIDKVARGVELLSPGVQAVADRLIRGEVPDAWDAIWEGPTDAKKWLSGLASRVAAIGDWAARVKAGAVLSAAVKLGDLFEPKIFLNALRQQTARVSRVPVDELKLVSCWEQGRLDSRVAPLTLTVHGMLLQGCNFDGQKLSESLLDSAANSALGDCFFAWMPRDAPSPYPNGESVKVPLYSSGSRSDAIADVLLPSARHDVNRWVLAGVALFVFADD